MNDKRSSNVWCAVARVFAGLAPRRALWLLEALCVLAALLVCNSHEGKALRSYKAGLRAQGEKRTLQEWAQPQLKGYAESRAVLLNVGNGLSRYRLNTGGLDLMRSVAPATARIGWKQACPPWSEWIPPIGRPSWSAFNDCLQEASGSLKLLRDALKTPPPASYPPITNLLHQPIANLVHLRLTGQWLAAETMYNLHQGRLEEALQDLEALGACAQINRDDVSLLSQLVRVALASLALPVTWEALQAPGWTEPQLARLQKAWEPVDLVDALEKAFIAERAQGEETWAEARTSVSGQGLRKLLVLNAATNLTLQTFVSDDVLFPLYRITSIDQDELFYLQSVQGTLTAIRNVKKGHPWTEAEDGLTQAGDKMLKFSRATGRFRHWLGLIAMPNLTRAVQLGMRAETQRQLTLADIALKRFQLLHTLLPLNLAVLSPEFLPVPTYDPMSGGSLQYILKYDRTFILYSVGKNARDDGGEAPFWYRGQYGLWEEPDAVWPWPEPEGSG